MPKHQDLSIEDHQVRIDNLVLLSSNLSDQRLYPLSSPERKWWPMAKKVNFLPALNVFSFQENGKLDESSQLSFAIYNGSSITTSPQMTFCHWFKVVFMVTRLFVKMTIVLRSGWEERGPKIMVFHTITTI